MWGKEKRAPSLTVQNTKWKYVLHAVQYLQVLKKIYREKNTKELITLNSSSFPSPGPTYKKIPFQKAQLFFFKCIYLQCLS